MHIEPYDKDLFIFNFYYSPLSFVCFWLHFYLSLLQSGKLQKKNFDLKPKKKIERNTLSWKMSRPWKIINGTLPISFSFLFAHFIHIRLWIWQQKQRRSKKARAHTSPATVNNNHLPGKVHWSKKSSRTQSKSIVGPMDLSTSNIPNIQIKQLR